MQRDEHLLAVIRYVERNPLRAGLVKRTQDWRWSSLWRRDGLEFTLRPPHGPKEKGGGRVG